MSQRMRENIVACAIFILLAGAALISLDFGPRARMIPLPLAMLGALLALIQLVWQNLGSTDRLKMDLIDAPEPGASGHDAPAPGPSESATAPRQAPSWSKQAGALGIVASLLAAILLVGLLPAVFIFTAGYFLTTRHYSPVATLLHTTAFTAAIYLLFFVALEVQPYHGLLGRLVASLE